MTWTFEEDFTEVRDQMRSKIGDIITSDPLISDEALAFYYSDAGNDLLEGSIRAARAAAARLAHECDTTASRATSAKSQRHKAMLEVITQLKTEQNTSPLKGDYSPDTSVPTETRDSEDYPDEYRLSSLHGPSRRGGLTNPRPSRYRDPV